MTASIEFDHYYYNLCIVEIKSMGIIVIIAFCSIFIAGGFLVAFLWSVKDGQFDDSYSPPNRILFEDKIRKSNNKQQ